MFNRAFHCSMGCGRACCGGAVLPCATTAPVCSLGSGRGQGKGCRAGILCTGATLPLAPIPLPPHRPSCGRRGVPSSPGPTALGLGRVQQVHRAPQQILLPKPSPLGPMQRGRRDTLQKYNYYCKGNARAPGLHGG